MSSFQFTLPCRERPDLRHQRPRRARFNSRSRVGSDSASRRAVSRSAGFNSRSRVGSDARTSQARTLHRCFNSRSRVGSDATYDWVIGNIRRFQFTLPCRERRRFWSSSSLLSVFQFTLPCRERHRRRPSSRQPCPGFNSRSRVGSDPHFNPSTRPQKSFNSRSRVGSDFALRQTGRSIARFQFTLPCRERLGHWSPSFP